MIPVRLSIMLTGIVILLLIAFANPEPVRLNLLFWSGRFELYKVIIGAIGFGALMSWIYVGHLRYVRRLRSGRFQR